MYGITELFWLICYGAAIWICVIGKRRNPNKGWNFIMAGEVLYIIVSLPLFYYYTLAHKIPIMFLIHNAQYVFYILWFLFVPVGMILILVGLYFIAHGKKKKSKKAGKKRRSR